MRTHVVVLRKMHIYERKLSCVQSGMSIAVSFLLFSSRRPYYAYNFLKWSVYKSKRTKKLNLLCNNSEKTYSDVVVSGNPLGTCFTPLHLTINLSPKGVQTHVLGQCGTHLTGDHKTSTNRHRQTQNKTFVVEFIFIYLSGKHEKNDLWVK